MKNILIKLQMLLRPHKKVQKTAEGSSDLTGNKITDKITGTA